jgi:Icc-related predicted phosphoesterase
MKNILACAGLFGDERALVNFISFVEEKKPDGILFAGGIMRTERSQEHRTDYMARFIEAIGKTGCRMAMIPGAHDAPLEEYFRISLNFEVVYPNIFSVHATPAVWHDIIIGGFGGNITETEIGTVDTINTSHIAAEYYLRRLWNAREPIKVLLISEAAPEKLSGTQGNPVIKEIINNYHPTLCVAGGTTDYWGSDTGGPTTIVNPGALKDGSAAWVDLISNKITRIDLRPAGVNS